MLTMPQRRRQRQPDAPLAGLRSQFALLVALALKCSSGSVGERVDAQNASQKCALATHIEDDD